MPLNINTNLSSLIVQSNLRKSTNGLNVAIERMTTGFKINRAKDNAANYSIATSLTTKINALQVASDNVNQGLSMVSTASASLSAMSNWGTKLRALVIQACNGTYSSGSLEALTNEATQLINEIYREKSNCKYNDIPLWGNEVNFHNDAMDLKLNSQGFLKEVKVRDTSKMVAFADIDATTAILSGTYSISTTEELAKLATMAKSDLIGADCEFVLANDIDLSVYNTGGGWASIGNSTNGFVAKFDGNGYTISNLFINSGASHGLFYKVASGAEVKNLRLSDVNVCFAWGSGCISGTVESGATVTNCSIEGGNFTQRENGSYYGGIVGSGSGTISYCYVDLNMHAGGHANGLIVGDGSAAYCFSKGTIAGAEVGGICGRGSAKNCASSADINGNDAGGIVSCYAGSIDGCYFFGSVKGIINAGGIVSSAPFRTKISNCYVAGTIEGKDGKTSIIGGVADYVVVENCYYDSSKTIGVPLYNPGTNRKDNITDTFAYAAWTFQVGINSAYSSTLNYTMHMENLGLYDILSKGLDSSDSLSAIDNFLNIIGTEQTKIGAIENRLMSVFDEINIQHENLLSSRSTIQDADVAEESSAYIRNQILQEAAATLLATANQSPAIALQLL